jgi:hypothetical protein
LGHRRQRPIASVRQCRWSTVMWRDAGLVTKLGWSRHGLVQRQAHGGPT